MTIEFLCITVVVLSMFFNILLTMRDDLIEKPAVVGACVFFNVAMLLVLVADVLL